MMDKEITGLSKIVLYKAKNFLQDFSIIQFDQYHEAAIGTKKGMGYALYFLKNSPSHPVWFKFFNEQIDLSPIVHKPLTQSAGFIFLINTEASTYAMAGGLGYHELTNKIPMESRFGIDIAKKILSQKELKGMAQKDASGILNSLDRVFRAQYNPSGDIDNLHRVLTLIRAKNDKKSALYREIGSSIKAGDSLTVSGTKDFSQVIDFIKKVDDIWLSEPDEPGLQIPELEPISPKYDKDLLLRLWNVLINFICRIDDDTVSSLFLDNIDVGYLPDLTDSYKVIYENRSYPCEFYEAVFFKVKEILLGVNETDRYETFQKIGLRIKFSGEDQYTPKKDLIHYICGDLTYDNESYFINNKNWYRANDTFIGKINDELDNVLCLPPENFLLKAWTNESEDKFNKSHSNLLMLHTNLIKIKGERAGIEFCDLLYSNQKQIYLIHVKKACGAELRALFAQGFVSAQLFADNKEYREKIFDLKKNLSPEDRKKLKGLKEKQKNNFWIIYAIFDDRESHRVHPQDSLKTTDLFSGTISLFAKIDLLSRVQSLRALGYNVALTRIRPYPEGI